MQKIKAFREPAIGIIVTMGLEMIQNNGGGAAFCKMLDHYTSGAAAANGSAWLHKCKNKPQQDIARVYITMEGAIYGRLYYGGHETGERKILRATGAWDGITWPRILLVGPMEKPPREILMSGFRGFRYITKDLW